MSSLVSCKLCVKEERDSYEVCVGERESKGFTKEDAPIHGESWVTMYLRYLEGLRGWRAKTATQKSSQSLLRSDADWIDGIVRISKREKRE